MRKAEKFLENARFDGKSSKFTFDRFIARMRQAFQDMEPGDIMSEQRKVTKLMNAWQVESLSHLDASVTGVPARATDFEAAVTFLKDQMA